MNQKTDVLLVTATKFESQAVYEVFQGATSEPPQQVSIGGWIYHDIGIVNGKRVFLVQSEMGSAGQGASQQTVRRGISDLSPTEVIMVGIAFGVNYRKQSIGDILVSQRLILYEPQRVGRKDGNLQIIPRGERPSASSRLLNCFRSVELGCDMSKFKVHFGPILSGEKLVDNPDFRQELQCLDPEAIGGEMEGFGLYVACQESKVDWIIVKSICDWADGNKARGKDTRQRLAAKNAASFVLRMLQVPSIEILQEESLMEKSRIQLIINDIDLITGKVNQFLGEYEKNDPIHQYMRKQLEFHEYSSQSIELSSTMHREYIEKISPDIQDVLIRCRDILGESHKCIINSFEAFESSSRNKPSIEHMLYILQELKTTMSIKLNSS